MSDLDLDHARKSAAKAVRRYGRECAHAVESFRCAEPDLDAAMEPYDALVARVREAEARLAATHLAVHPECATTCEHGATA